MRRRADSSLLLCAHLFLSTQHLWLGGANEIGGDIDDYTIWVLTALQLFWFGWEHQNPPLTAYLGRN
jgi:hypothetical protein